MRHYLLAGLVLLPLFLFVWNRFFFISTGIDDANIFLVYAKNLAEGSGFVYNQGGERVEGFSSILWTLIGALSFRLFGRPEIPLLLLNLIVTLSIGVLGVHFLGPVWGEKKRSAWGPLLFFLLLFSMPTYLFWNTISLMESGIWGLLLLLNFVAVTAWSFAKPAEQITFASLLILLLLTRPESYFWSLLFVTILGTRQLHQHGLLPALKTVAWPALTILLTIGAITLFRLSYFGYPFPNTYYAKVSPSFSYNVAQGGIYLLKYLSSHPLVWIPTFALPLALFTLIKGLFASKEPIAPPLWLPLIGLAGLTLPLLTGGDHFGGFRFYQPIYPFLLLNLFYTMLVILPTFQEWEAVLQGVAKIPDIVKTGIFSIGILGLLLFQANYFNQVDHGFSVDLHLARSGRERGTYFDQLFEQIDYKPSIGIVTAGGAKLTYSGEMVDLLGLNNVAMGHSEGDRRGYKNHAAFSQEVFYELAPEMVVPKLAAADGWTFDAADIQSSLINRVQFRYLFDEPQFLEQYVFVTISSPIPVEADRLRDGETIVAGWARRDFLDRLYAADVWQIREFEYNP